MKLSHKILLFCILSVAFISCDRVTKDLAKTHLMNRPDISYFHHTIVLEYVENTGAALSMGDNLPKAVSFWLLSVMPLVIILVVLGYVIKNMSQMSLLRILSFAMIISGGLGNIIDRIAFDRHVTDFMNVGIMNLRTGIFNVADMCVTAGVIGLFFSFRDKTGDLKKATPESAV